MESYQSPVSLNGLGEKAVQHPSRDQALDIGGEVWGAQKDCVLVPRLEVQIHQPVTWQSQMV